MFLSFIIGGIKALVTSLWQGFFPARTAADQRAADLTKQVNDAATANKISDEVSRESIGDVNADLDKRVRPGSGQ